MWQTAVPRCYLSKNNVHDGTRLSNSYQFICLTQLISLELESPGLFNFKKRNG